MKTIHNYDSEVLGRRLKQARMEAQITQDFAAKEIGVARTTIVAIEKGQRKLKDNEFVRLCSLYKIAASSILRPSQKREDIIFKFRRDSRVQVDSPGAQDAIELLLSLASASEELESMMGKSRYKTQLYQHVIQNRDIKTQAEDAASALRQKIGIGSLPVGDLFSILEFHLDFSVFVREIDSNISGLYVNNDQIGHCMLLNAKHSLGRLYFTAAHELGHAVSSVSAYHVNFEGHEESSEEEIFANSFASSFLMPASFIRKVFDEFSAQGAFSPRQLIVMAKTTGVSPEAMCRRLEGLGLLKQGTYDSIKERGFSVGRIDTQICKKQSTGAHPVPERVRLLMADAYSDGLLSEGQLAKKFSLDRIEIRELLDTMQVEKPAV